MKRIITLAVLITATLPICAGQEPTKDTSYIKEVTKNVLTSTAFCYAPYTTTASLVAHALYKNSQVKVTDNGDGDGTSGSGNGGGGVSGWRK